MILYMFLLGVDLLQRREVINEMSMSMIALEFMKHETLGYMYVATYCTEQVGGYHIGLCHIAK